MTEEQIAELRRLDAAASPSEWPLAPEDMITRNGLLLTEAEAAVLVAARNALPRLLEERKRLLEALRAVEWTGGMGDQHCSICRGYSRQWGDGHGHVAGCKLADAIAFAEEPAP